MKVNKEAIIQFIQRSKQFVVRNKKLILTGVASYATGIVTIIVLMIMIALNDPVEEYVDIALLEEAYSEIDSLEKQLSDKKGTISDLESDVVTLQAKVDDAAPWFKLADEEQKQVEAEAKAAEEKRLAEEQAKKEAEEKAKKEAEEKAEKEAEEKEKRGYNTGITYNQLARTPDDYLAEKVKFSGKVIQVMESDGYTAIRLAVGGNYDNVIYGQYLSSTVSSRVLEDDNITIYGMSTGLFTYESTMGGQISIPGVVIEKIDQ